MRARCFPADVRLHHLRQTGHLRLASRGRIGFACYGSQVCLPGFHQRDYSLPLRFSYTYERAIYMVNSFQFTRSARLSLVFPRSLNREFYGTEAADLASAVDRNGDGATIRVSPPLVTSGLALTFKSKARGNTAELLRSAARHARSRWCPRARITLCRGIRWQSSRTLVRARPGLLLWPA